MFVLLLLGLASSRDKSHKMWLYLGLIWGVKTLSHFSFTFFSTFSLLFWYVTWHTVSYTWKFMVRTWIYMALSPAAVYVGASDPHRVQRSKEQDQELNNTASLCWSISAIKSNHPGVKCQHDRSISITSFKKYQVSFKPYLSRQAIFFLSMASVTIYPSHFRKL